MRALEAQYGREAVVDALRAEAAHLRAAAANGTGLPDDVADTIERAMPARLASSSAPSLRAVINATGVIIHTNLGRAPLSSSAAARVAALAQGYTNLEYDLARGARGRRDAHAETLLCRLTGAEAAVVVNNNAAATMLALAALGAGREVLISRGELVEIGGGFRVPDVMKQSGAILREVGTTNRTRAADYAAAISDRTALILRVHPSNFRIEGFTERPRLDELVALGQRFKLAVIEDLGSGYVPLTDPPPALIDEPTVRASVDAGVDVVMFSGDKLLGGPQAGILAGRASAMSVVRRHPLMRALRVDKLTYAALEATLEEYVAGRAVQAVPVARMIAMTIEDLDGRARRVADALSRAGWRTEIVDAQSTIGGGSAPGSAIATRAIALSRDGLSCDGVEEMLRGCATPIVARIENDRVLLDLRTVPIEQDDLLVKLISGANSST